MEAMLAAASSTPATALAPSTSPTITSQRVIVLSLPVLAALRIRQGPCPSPDPRLRPFRVHARVTSSLRGNVLPRSPDRIGLGPPPRRRGTIRAMAIQSENDPPAEEQQSLPMILPGSAQGPVVEQPAKLIRIASMIRELLQDVRQSQPDEAGRKRLRDVYERALAALKERVSKELQDELETLTLPLENTPSESEVRLAQAQLLGWRA